MTARSFSFRLETVLRVRRVEETRAREVLAGATRVVALRSAAARRTRAACDALPCVLPPMPAQEFDALRTRAGWLDEQATTARAALEVAVTRHELARRLLVSANQKVSALERLAERRLQEWQDEVVRAETAELDDVVGSRVAAARLDALEQLGASASPPTPRRRS